MNDVIEIIENIEFEIEMKQKKSGKIKKKSK